MPTNRARHSKPAIEKAVQYAEQSGWRFVKSSPHAHSWGKLYCPHSTREGCIVSVWSTPKSPENHARQIIGKIDSCPHREQQADAPAEESHESDE